MWVCVSMYVWVRRVFVETSVAVDVNRCLDSFVCFLFIFTFHLLHVTCNKSRCSLSKVVRALNVLANDYDICLTVQIINMWSCSNPKYYLNLVLLKILSDYALHVKNCLEFLHYLNCLHCFNGDGDQYL